MKPYVKKLIKANYRQVLFVFIAFLAMILVSYFYASDIVENQMFAIGEETMNTTQTAVTAVLNRSEFTFANIAQSLESMLSNGRTNDEILDFLVTSNDYFSENRSSMPDFMKVYAYIRGEFLDGSGWVPPDDYIPAMRPWHIGAEYSGNKIFFSEPYIDAETGGMCVSFSQKMFDRSGGSHGVLAIDLKLTSITDYVSRQKIANNGYGVLLSDTMHFTSHKNPELIGIPMEEAGEGYRGLERMIRFGRTVAAQRFTDYDGTDSVAYFRTIFNGWHIGVIIPRDSYYRPVYSLRSALVILGLCLMLALSCILVRTRAEKMRSDEESASKSTFLARMSHEMRTPMNAIIGMAGIAGKTDDPERIQYCLGKIDAAAGHLLGVINDILDISKIEAGKLELSTSDFPLEGMLEQVKNVVGLHMEKKRQNFTVTIAEEVPRAIVSDRQRLAQVLANLLSNANKFTPEGGEISLCARRLEDAGDRCTLEFSVADNGIGISKDQQARLFRSFEQADVSISRRYGGTGLGLAISKKIIEAMGGDVSVESEPGRGAKFLFTIRAGVGTSVADAPAAAPAGQGETAGIFKDKKVLMAEDVAINREILISLLEDTGISIDCAEDGRKALEMFKSAPGLYDMIFMDIHMPEMDGYEATACIRACELPRSKTIPIIAMTANVFREDIEKCAAAGMNAHLGKPIDLDEVIATIKRFM